MTPDTRSRPLVQSMSVAQSEDWKGKMARLLRENGLSLVLFGFFVVFLIGQSLVGWHQYNQDAVQHAERTLSFAAYLASGHFWEAVFENWESEFLQMAAYVVLTSFLYQKGSAESKKLPEEGENPQDEDPLKGAKPNSPREVRRGGWALTLYQRSLSGALGLFFLLSFTGHALAGSREFDQERQAHGEAAAGVVGYVSSSQFWFESLQNWQSEFLAVFALVVLSIWLRDRGSPESKPVAAPHAETGTS